MVPVRRGGDRRGVITREETQRGSRGTIGRLGIHEGSLMEKRKGGREQ